MVYYAIIVPTLPYTIQHLESEIRPLDTTAASNIERKNVAPYSYEVKRVHFVMNEQFLQMRTSQRNVEISHWGNINFHETYDMQNRAAPFIGEFSTLDFNRGSR